MAMKFMLLTLLPLTLCLTGCDFFEYYLGILAFL